MVTVPLRVALRVARPLANRLRAAGAEAVHLPVRTHPTGRTWKPRDPAEPWVAPVPGVVVTATSTGNPHTMRFSSNRTIVEQSVSFSNAAAATDHPLGRALFALDDVRIVFASSEYVTVTKQDSAHWGDLVPVVTEAIRTALA